MTPAPDPSWERRHPGQREQWSFDFSAAGAGLGGFVGLTLHPPPRPLAWYWAALVGTGRPYLLVRDLEIDAPRRPDSLDIRAEGLWADVNCETPFDHWSMGLEAFGVAMDDPDEALGAERGDRIGLGLDLEWEAVAEITGGEGDYAQPCAVHGEILVGLGSAVETIAFEGHGWRRHTWCPPGTVGPEAEHFRGRLDDGTPFSLEAPENPPDREILFRAPLRLDDGAIFERSLCRFTSASGTGTAWHEQITQTG